MEQYTECPKCGKALNQILDTAELIYYCRCTECDWEDERNIWETYGDNPMLMTDHDALRFGYAKACPYTKKICPRWEIDEIGMCIEMWHKQNKGTLTTA